MPPPDPTAAPTPAPAPGPLFTPDDPSISRPPAVTPPSSAPAVPAPIFSSSDDDLTEHPDRAHVLAPAGGIEADPARAAKVLQLQDATGGKLPSQFINENLDDVQKAVSQRGFDPDGYLAKSPVVKQWLAENPARQALTADDLPGLARLEYLIRSDPQLHYLPDGSIVQARGNGNYGTVYPTLQAFQQALINQSGDARDLQKQMDALPGASFAPGLTRLGLSLAAASGMKLPEDFPSNLQLLRDKSLQSSGWLSGMTRVAADATQGVTGGLRGAFNDDADTRALVAATPPTMAGQLGAGVGGLIAQIPLMLAGGPVARAAVGVTRAVTYAKSLGSVRALWDILEPSLGGTIKAAGTTSRAAEMLANAPVSGVLEHAAAGVGGMQPLAIQGGVDEAQRTGSPAQGLASWASQSAIAGIFGPVGASRLAMRLSGQETASAGAARLVLSQTGLGALQGQAFALQQAIQDYANGTDPEALDWHKLGPSLAISGILNGAAGGVFSAPEAWQRGRRLVEGFGADLPSAQDALQGADRMRQVAEAVSELKAQALHQPSVEGLLQKLAQSQDLQTLYVRHDAWDAHFQPQQAEPGKPGAEAEKATWGSPRDAAAAILGDPTIYDRAKAAEQAIPVPLERFATTLAGTPHMPWFVGEARTSPDARNEREVTEHAKALLAELQEAVSHQDTSPEARAQADQQASGDLIQEDAKRQFAAAGYSDSVAETHAAVVRGLVQTGASKIGKDPWQHYQEQKLKITSELPKLLRSRAIQDQYDRMLTRLKAEDVPSEKTAQGAREAGSDFEPIAAERDQLVALRKHLEGMGADIAKEPVAQLKARLLGHAQARASEAEAQRQTRAASPDEPVDREQGVPIHVADVPYGAGTSRDGSAVYIDRRIPRFLEIDGKRVNIHKLIARHELAEKIAMDHGESYATAHNHALHVEDEDAEKEGIRHADYEAAVKPYVDAAKKEAQPEGIPMDLNEQPYRDMGEEGLLNGRSGFGRSDEAQPLQQAIGRIAPRGESLEMEDLLKQYRKANGDRTPIQGSQEWMRLQQEAQRVDRQRGVLYQAGEKGEEPRGTYLPRRLNPNDEHLITLGQAKDRSTALHEVAHFALEYLHGLSQDPNAPPELKADLAAVREWMGTGDGQVITREQHEQFATAWEGYVMEGKAPSSALRVAFARISKWITDIWKHLRGDPRAKLTPQIREVFDRMLATNEEITAAKAELGPGSMWKTREDSGMNQGDWEDYQNRLVQNDATAHSILQREVMESMVREESQAYQDHRAKVHAQVQTETDAQPLWVALRALQHGEVPEGFETPEGPLKLDRRELVDRFGANSLDLLPGPQRGDEPKPNRGPVIYSKDGMSLESAARAFGFPDGQTLWNALIHAPDHDALVDHLTDAELKKQGQTDPLQDGTLQDRARAAVVNDWRLRALRSEAAALANQLGKAASEAQIQRATEKSEERSNAQQQRAELKEQTQIENAADRAKQAVERAKAQQAKQAESQLRDRIIDGIRNRVTIAQPGELEAIAAAHIRSQAVRDIKPARYRKAMIDAGKAAAAALEKARGKDPITRAQHLAEALKQKQREELNTHCYDMAMDGLKYSDKSLAYHRSFAQMDKRRRLGRAGGHSWAVAWPDPRTGETTSQEFNTQDYQKSGRNQTAEQATQQAALDEAAKHLGSNVTRTGYLEMIDAAHEAVNLRRASPKEMQRRESLRQFIARKERDGDHIELPQDLREDLGRTPWNALTLQKQHDMTDYVRNLERLANTKTKLMAGQRLRDFTEQRDQVVEQMEKSRPKSVLQGAPIPDLRWSIGDNPVQFAGKCLAALRKVSSYCREMDDFKDGGVVWEAMQRPNNDAMDYELREQEALGAKWAADIKTWGKVKPLDMKSNHWRHSIPGIDKRYSRFEAIEMMRNWGNEGNRDRLMQSEKLTADQVLHVINTVLDKADMDHAQRGLDLVESFWPKIKAKTERVSGVAPEKVEALPIVTRHGVYRGGYYPIAYDSRTTIRDVHAADEGGIIKSGASLYASTKRGHTEARTGMQPGTRIRLDPNVIAEHLNQVIHDLAFHETVLDQNKMLKDREFHDTVVRGWGVDAYRQFQAGLRDTAAGMASPKIGWDKMIEYLRQGTNYAARAANLGTAIQQVAGLPQVLVRVGPKHFAQAIVAMFHSPGRTEHVFRWVEERSTRLRNRAKLFDKNMADANLGVGMRGPVRSVLDKAGYYFWTKAFQVLDTHTWMASYLKSMDEGRTEKDAIAIADQTVSDVQGSGATPDLPAVMRQKGWSSIFTANMSWWLSNYNLSAEAVNQLRRGGTQNILKGGCDLFILYAVQTALWSATETAMTGKDAADWDSPGALAKRLGSDSAYSVMSSIPLVREFAQTVTEGKDYQGPFGLRSFNQLAEAMKDSLYGKDTDKAHAARNRAIGQAAGAVFHLPIPIMMNIMEQLTDHDQSAGQTARGLLFGHQYAK